MRNDPNSPLDLGGASLVERVASALHARIEPIRTACASPLVAVLFAIALVAVGAVLRQVVGEPGSRFVTFFPAMALGALLGGVLCGLTATGLALVTVALEIFGDPHHLPARSAVDVVSFCNFALTGLIVSFVAATDLTVIARDRRRSARAIGESEAHRQSIVTALHEGVLVFDSEGRLLSANPSAERILGRTEQEMRRNDGFDGWGLVEEDGRPVALADYPAILALYSGVSVHSRVVGIPVGARIVWLLNNAEPVRDPQSGRITAVVISFTDVTERRAIDRQLAESRARFASIVETAMDAIVSVDEDQRIVLFNSAAERMFGCPADRAIGLPLTTFVPERHHARHTAGFTAFATEAVASRAMGAGRRLVARRLDGSEFPIEASISRNEVAGRPLFTVVHRDITTRLQAEGANARLATVVTFAPTAIVTANTDGIIDSWNAGAADLFGYTAEEAIGRPVEFLSFPDDDDNGRVLFERVLAGENVRDESVRRRADGSPVEVARIAGAVRDEEGRVIAVVAVMSDIGERKRQERLLREREEEQRQTLDAAGLGVWWIDLGDGLVHVDPRSRRLFAVDDGTPFDVLTTRFHPDDRAALAGLRRSLTPRDTSFELTLRAGPSDRAPVWLHITARLRVSARGGEEIWGTVQDVTERRNAEAALKQIEANRRLEALGRMTGGIAHDFNNLLTVISGNLQLLETTTADPTSARWIAEALRATETGAALNHRLSTFARQRRLEPVVTDLDRRIGAMIDLLHRSVGPGISVIANFAEDLWPVRVDPSEIEHALLNLVFNARDAMPDGGRVVIETANVVLDDPPTPADPTRRVGPHVRLSVTDTGHGMTPEVRARAFEPFFTTKESGRGTGLGLSTLHGFVRQSGGFVSLYSEPGHGTTVNVYLPRAEENGEAEPDTRPPPRRRGAGEHILLVEDDPDVARVTRDRLIASGWHVEEVADAHAALARLAAGPPVDLVFSDIMMPGGLSGIDLARRLRARDPACRILLTSGFSEEIARGDRDRPLEFPILRKPYSYADLTRAIAEALDVPAPQPRETSQVKT